MKMCTTMNAIARDCKILEQRIKADKKKGHTQQSRRSSTSGAISYIVWHKWLNMAKIEE